MSTAPADKPSLLDLAPDVAEFGRAVLAGLNQRPRRLPCKFFYDDRGSELFEQICDTPEYYPTRTELGILLDYADAMADFCGSHCRLVELGSGSSRKTRLLLDALATPDAYVPIDISREHLLRSAIALRREYPTLNIRPVSADYTGDVRLPPAARGAGRTVIFFPGSTLGNFEPDEAAAFLTRVGTWCEPGDRLLLGVDLDKPREILEPAYNDAAGVTAAFNLNLLVRANRELGASFNLDQFRHEAVYDSLRRRVEMRLVSECRQNVEVNGQCFTFDRHERIITEYSHKFTRRSLQALARESGWQVATSWTDDRAWFAVVALVRDQR